MPEFSVNVHRMDPYKNFKFRVKWDGKPVPGIIQVTGLTRRTLTEKTSVNERQPYRFTPGRTIFDPIVLVRGRTHDSEFEKWANKVWQLGGNPNVEPTNYKKDIVIELLNEAGQLVMAFQVFNCWPIRYNPMGDLDANDTDIATERLVLIHEGWARDAAVAEPTEPSYTFP